MKYINICLLFILLGFLTTISTNSYGQTIVNFSQYSVNPYMINPAAAGTNGGQEVFAHFRSQWQNLPTAPKTKLVTYAGKFNRNGLGLQFFNDKSGAFNVNSIAGTYNYQLPVSETGNLSIGLSVQYLGGQLNPSQTTLEGLDNDDPLLVEAMEGVNTLESSFGAYYYNENGLYAGISTPNIIRTKLGGIETNEVGLVSTNLMVYGGYKMKLSEQFTINPSVLVRQMNGGSTQVEINSQFLLLDETLMVGGSYRTGEKALVAMFGINIENTIRLYYSYDATFNEISNYSNGSNELTLGFRLSGKKISE